jgi:hypothetical protein
VSNIALSSSVTKDDGVYSVKFRTQASKTYTNRIIHKRYLATSKHWQVFTANEKHDAPVAPNNEPDAEDEISAPQFTPITVLHMYSNPNLVRARIVKALKGRDQNTMAHSDVIHAINITPTQVPQRRKLNRMIDQMADEGIILKGVVPSKSGNLAVVQLVDESLLGLQQEPGDEKEGMLEGGQLEEEGSDIEPLDLSRLRYTLPVERQILDVIQNAGETGVIQKVRSAHRFRSRILGENDSHRTSLPL